MSRFRALVPLALMTLTPLGPAAMADERTRSDPAADAELLEFLGSVDSGADAQGADDGSWIEYLWEFDVDEIAATSERHAEPRVKRAAAAARPGDSGDKKDE